MNPSVADDPLLRHRTLFPILAHTNYLISNSLGAMPATVADSLREYHETWSNRGVRAWEEGWWTLAADLGDRLAPLIGARQGEVVFQPCVTLAHAVLLSALEPRPGRNRIILDDGHFPSIRYLAEGLAARGFEIKVVPSKSNGYIDTDRFLDAIDDRTVAVLVCHVQFRTAEIVDVRALAERARRSNAWTIVDGYQSVGTIPVDARALGVDAYIGGCLKWLCGGPGNAFLWVDPERVSELSPQLTGWMAHRRPFAFEPTLDRRDDAWRFLHGTPSIPALHAAAPALSLIQSIGIEAIRARSLRHTDRLLIRADTHGWPSPTPRDPSRRGGTVAFDVPHGLAVSRALKARDILCDYRPGVGIRLSPHFYNLDQELDDAADAIHEILTTRAWQSFLETRSPVT